MTTTAMQATTAAAETALTTAGDSRLSAAVIASIVLHGDISGLDQAQKATYYVARCRQLGLDPQSKPFQILKLNGKEILYTDKGAADQLAKIHRVNRRITDGPRTMKLGSKELLFVQVEASLPNGRSEMDVATVPLAGDLDNLLMKLVTKGKRRATLAILGLGCLDETEIEAIPARSIGERVDVDLSLAGIVDEAPQLDPADAAGLSDVTDLDGLARWYADLAIGGEDADRADAASGLAGDHLSAKGYRLASVEHSAALRGKLDPALRSAHDVLAAEKTLDGVLRQCRALRPGASDDAKRAMARYFGALCSPPIADPRKAGRALADALSLETPPDGPRGGQRTLTTQAPADAHGATVAPSNDSAAAPAARETRVVLDIDEAEARLLRSDATGDAAWAQRLTDYAAVFAMAGAYHKRAGAFREAGVLAKRRAQTLAAIEAREQRGPEAARQALDGYATRRVMPRGYGAVVQMPQRSTAKRTGTDD